MFSKLRIKSQIANLVVSFVFLFNQLGCTQTMSRQLKLKVDRRDLFRVDRERSVKKFVENINLAHLQVGERSDLYRKIYVIEY